MWGWLRILVADYFCWVQLEYVANLEAGVLAGAPVHRHEHTAHVWGQVSILVPDHAFHCQNQFGHIQSCFFLNSVVNVSWGSGIKMLANLPVTIVLVPKMCTPCLCLLHHQLGVVVVQLPTSKQLLQGSNNLQR